MTRFKFTWKPRMWKCFKKFSPFSLNHFPFSGFLSLFLFVWEASSEASDGPFVNLEKQFYPNLPAFCLVPWLILFIFIWFNLFHWTNLACSDRTGLIIGYCWVWVSIHCLPLFLFQPTTQNTIGNWTINVRQQDLFHFHLISMYDREQAGSSTQEIMQRLCFLQSLITPRKPKQTLH